MRNIRIILLCLVIGYVLQIFACSVRTLIPYKTLSLGHYRVQAIYGINSHQPFVPLWGFLIFYGDGNRIKILKDGTEVREITIDLFEDFQFDAVHLSDGKLWIPDPGGSDFWMANDVPDFKFEVQQR